MRGHLYQTAIVLLLLAVGRGVVAGDGKRSPESDLAAPGAPLYEKAVKESVITLMSKQEQAALDDQGRPPSPGPDYFWCKNCKTYHKKTAPASPGQQQAGQTPGAAPASPQQPGAATAARPPSPGPDHFWCENCKTYHKKQAVPNQHGAVNQGTPVPQAVPAAAPGTAARPPSPGKDYFWCENCKTYHMRQPAAQQSGASPAAPPAHAIGTVADQAPGADYYYCEKCKTYHHRKPVAQLSVEDLIVGGATNNPHQNPLVAP